jgi:hypothetical protein
MAAAGVAAGNSIAIPPATHLRKDSEPRGPSGASLETTTREDVDIVVPARRNSATTSQYTSHLEAIEEGRQIR